MTCLRCGVAGEGLIRTRYFHSEWKMPPMCPQCEFDTAVRPRIHPNWLRPAPFPSEQE